MAIKKNSFLKSSIIAGALLSSVGLQSQAADMLSFEDLGSGAEIRARLTSSTRFSESKPLELKCGTSEKTEIKEGKTTDAKCGEGKCGEGKCGEKETSSKSKKNEGDEKKEQKHEKQNDMKMKDAKCGEGKCGN